MCPSLALSRRVISKRQAGSSRASDVFPLHHYGKCGIPLAIQGIKAMTDGNRLSILKGALDVLILKALSWGPMHGYSVSYWIRKVTDEALELQEGVLYPALHRLERKGWIESEWGVSENNRNAKYYSLTRLGRKRLQLELYTWERFANAVGKVVKATEKPDWLLNR
jgi:PadR family transcriptional regulator